MITVKFKVTETEVRLTEKSDRLISGNVEQIKCLFDLSPEYEGLIVRASFNGEYRTLVNNECFAPELTSGRCEIGVYGFDADGDKLKCRISPIPCTEYVYQGSYSLNISQAALPSTTELEAYYIAVKKLINNMPIPDINLTAEDKQQIASMTINDKQESASQTYSSQKIKNMISNILEFKLITTAEELAEIFSFDENGNANWNCKTMYMVLNEFLGAEYYPADRFVEFMMLGTDSDLDIFEQMEIFGSLAMMPFDDFVTKEQLENELNSRATHYDYGGHGNTLQLKNNTEFHWGNMSELTIMLPNSAGMFHSTVIFDSPSPATILTAPARITFVGDDCADGVLVPSENTSYEIDIKLVSVSKILAKVTAF